MIRHAGGGWRITVADVSGDALAASPPCALFFGDPPYNIGIDYGRGKRADRLTTAEYLAFQAAWLFRAVQWTRPGGAVWTLLPDEWAADAAVYLNRTLGLERRNWVKWHETFGSQTKTKFARTSRHLLYHVVPGGPAAFAGDAVKVPSARQTTYRDKRAAAGGKVPGDVWAFPRVCGTFRERAEGFPTQVPEALLTRIVLACTRRGDLVREFFAGSGSLARVCVRHGRLYDGYEANARYAEMAAARVRESLISG